jgi:hypothetical protein
MMVTEMKAHLFRRERVFFILLMELKYQAANYQYMPGNKSRESCHVNAGYLFSIARHSAARHQRQTHCDDDFTGYKSDVTVRFSKCGLK